MKKRNWFRWMTGHWSRERRVEALKEQTRLVQQDLNRLTDQIIDISMGNLTVAFKTDAKPLSLPAGDDLNELASAHNLMIERLDETGDAIATIIAAMAASREKLQNVNQWLEKVVAERTEALQKANRELEVAHHELSRLDQAKNEFLRMISHEIRTPLNGIMGFTYMMKDLPQAPEVAAIFDILDISVKRLEQFSKAALLITTLKTRSIDIHRAIVSPVSLVRKAENLLVGPMTEKQVTFHTDSDSEREIINGDPELLAICIHNILENAVHYSPKGGVISITTTPEKERILLSVRDQGKGFSAAALNNLFKPFSPGEQHIDQNIGLDLALVRMIMEAHGAAISAGNPEGGGACVTLIFPVAQL